MSRRRLGRILGYSFIPTLLENPLYSTICIKETRLFVSFILMTSFFNICPNIKETMPDDYEKLDSAASADSEQRSSIDSSTGWERSSDSARRCHQRKNVWFWLAQLLCLSISIFVLFLSYKVNHFDESKCGENTSVWCK